MKIFNWINKIPSGGEKEPLIKGKVNKSGGTYSFYINRSNYGYGGITITVPVDSNGYFEWNNDEGYTITGLAGMFYEKDLLTEVEFSEDFDTSNVTTMAYMFTRCNDLTSVDLSGWDTSSVTNMNNMFNSCNNLTSLDLSGWDTSSVTNMAEMFVNCSKLTSLKLDNWTTTQVTTYSYFVPNDSKLTIDYKPSKWNSAIVSASSNVKWHSVE